MAGHRHLNRELTEYIKAARLMKIMKIPSTKNQISTGFGCALTLPEN